MKQELLIGKFRAERKRCLADMRNCNIGHVRNKLCAPFAQQQLANCGHLVLTILVSKSKVKVSWCKMTYVPFLNSVNILENATEEINRITRSRILLQEAMVPHPFDNLARLRWRLKYFPFLSDLFLVTFQSWLGHEDRNEQENTLLQTGEDQFCQRVLYPLVLFRGHTP